MKFFVDTADLDEIKKLSEAGFLDGVTTNPSLVKQSGHDNFIDLITEITKTVHGPVSAEVAATDYETMMKEGQKLAKIASNVVVKLPITPDGLKACRHLTDDGIMTNVTLCFSSGQALLAAKAGATYISPFVGRLDDVARDGLDLVENIVHIYDNYGFKTQVLVASVRNPMQVVESARIGADVITVPPKILWQLFEHPLTHQGLEAFTKDWKLTGQSIL